MPLVPSFSFSLLITQCHVSDNEQKQKPYRAKLCSRATHPLLHDDKDRPKLLHSHNAVQSHGTAKSFGFLSVLEVDSNITKHTFSWLVTELYPCSLLFVFPQCRTGLASVIRRPSMSVYNLETLTITAQSVTQNTVTKHACRTAGIVRQAHGDLADWHVRSEA